MRSAFNRRGSMMITVIVLGAILMAMSVVLMQGSASGKERNFEQKERVQSLFVAKGAQQHALLKIRLLPTPFYDAVAFATGKNPYFDFTKPIDVYTNPGPMFFTGGATITPAVPVPQVARSGNWFFGPEDQKFDGVMATHLNRFIKDIRSDYPLSTPQKAVEISSTPHNDLAFGSGWFDPFNASYKVEQIFVLGSRGKMSYSTDGVVISTRGIVRRADQKSITLMVGSEPHNLTRQYLKYATVQAGSGFEGMVDTKVSNQEKFAFGEQFAADLPTAERGEIVTGVYEVQRRN